MDSPKQNEYRITINNVEVSKTNSILKRKTSNSKEIIITKKLKLWIYNNKITLSPKKITKKQITFLCRLFSLFVKYQHNPTSLKHLASRLYIPPEIVEKVLEIPQVKQKLTSTSPISLLKEVINFLTLNMSSFFSLSFFSILTLPIYQQTNNIETYIQNYRKINSENLKLFKTLMKKDIVIVSNNLLGDYLIYPQIPNQKTKKNSIIINKGKYIIPLDKINIIDLVVIAYISSSTKIVENTLTGRISKKKIQQIILPNISKEINEILIKLNLIKTQ